MRTFLKAFSLSILLTLLHFSQLFAQPGTWVQQAGGQSAEFPRAMTVDANGDIYVTGHFRDTITLGGQVLESAGETDIFVAKFNDAGTLQWANRYGWFENDHASAIQLDGLGNVYIAGEFQDSTIFDLDTLFINTFSADTQGISDGLVDLYILKLNTAGTKQWVRKGGGWGSDFANDIALNSTGEVYVAGSYRTRFMLVDTLANSGYNDIYVAKINDAGAWQWDLGAHGVLFEEAQVIELIGDSVFYIAGYFQDTVYFKDSTVYVASKGAEDIFLAKYAWDGTFRWVKSMGGKREEKVSALLHDAAGNLYLSGYFEDTINFWGTQVISSGRFDGFVSKLDANGTPIWIKTLSSPEFESIEDLALEGNTLVATGYYQGTANFGSLTLQAASPFDQDVFFGSMDLSGNVNWIRSGGGVSADAGKAVGLDPNGYMTVLGEFGDSAWFGQAQLVSTGGLDMFLIHVDANGSVSVQEGGSLPALAVKLWPNPANAGVQIEINGPEAQSISVKFLDLQGRILLEKAIGLQSGSARWEWETDHLPNGMYLIQFSGSQFNATSKLIIEH